MHISKKSSTFAVEFETAKKMDDDLYTLDLFLLADDHELMAEKLGSVFARFREIIQLLKGKTQDLIEALKSRDKRIRELETELLYYRTHYPPPDQPTLAQGDAAPGQPPKDESMSIFRNTNGEGLRICREKLEEILTTSKTKSEVCRRLALYEETYFNFNKHKNIAKARLLNQHLPYNSHLACFTEADFKKYWSYAKKKHRKPNTTNH